MESQVFGQAAGGQRSTPNAVPRENLVDLRDRLAGLVTFARELGYRANGHADTVFGLAPTDINQAVKPGNPGNPEMPSVSFLIKELEEALGQISAGLNRL